MMTLCKLRGKILLLVQLWWIIVEIAEKAREFGPKNDGLRLLKSSSYVMQLLARWYEIGDTWGERKALWSHIWRVTGKLFQQIVRHESEFLIQLTMRSWTKRRRTAELTKTSGRWRQERVAKKDFFRFQSHASFHLWWAWTGPPSKSVCSWKCIQNQKVVRLPRGLWRILFCSIDCCCIFCLGGPF